MPKYYSARPPALVTRYGTGTYIGAALKIGASGQVEIVFDPEAVVAISDEEVVRYSREYLTHERDGALVIRSADDFAAWCELEAEASAIKPPSADDAEPLSENKN